MLYSTKSYYIVDSMIRTVEEHKGSTLRKHFRLRWRKDIQNERYLRTFCHIRILCSYLVSSSKNYVFDIQVTYFKCSELLFWKSKCVSDYELAFCSFIPYAFPYIPSIFTLSANPVFPLNRMEWDLSSWQLLQRQSWCAKWNLLAQKSKMKWNGFYFVWTTLSSNKVQTRRY